MELTVSGTCLTPIWEQWEIVGSNKKSTSWQTPCWAHRKFAKRLGKGPKANDQTMERPRNVDNLSKRQTHCDFMWLQHDSVQQKFESEFETEKCREVLCDHLIICDHLWSVPSHVLHPISVSIGLASPQLFLGFRLGILVKIVKLWQLSQLSCEIRSGVQKNQTKQAIGNQNSI